MTADSLNPLEKKLVDFLEKGEEPTLFDLGGLAKLQQNERMIGASPLLPEFICTLLGESVTDQEYGDSIIEFTSRLISCINDPMDMANIIDEIHLCSFLSKNWEKHFFEFFLARAFELNHVPLSRAFMLEGAFRFVQQHIPKRMALLAKLTDIDKDDDPFFLRHAAKIIGISYSWWRSEGLVEQLKVIVNVEDACDEAAFELGMAYLVEGLNATTKESVSLNFDESRKWFDLAIGKREYRPDAILFHTTLQIWLDFSNGTLPEKLTELVNVVKQESLAIQVWHNDVNIPRWLGARYSETASWYFLTVHLANFATNLEKHSWIDARFIIEQELISIITANRTIVNHNGGLDTLVLPKITIGLHSKLGLVQHLQDWLSENSSHPDVASVGKLLSAASEIQSANEERAEAAFKKTVEMLFGPLSGPVDSSFEYYVMKNCAKVLQDVEDYNNYPKAQTTFNGIMLILIRYLIIRMDLTLQNAPQLHFLFKPKNGDKMPLEDSLQRDLYDYLTGFLNSGNHSIEKSDIASGRVDIFITADGFRFIIEVKRELTNASFENLKESYASQATEYQNTNIRLSILLVLDLTDKKNGVAHVTDQVRAYSIKRPGEQSQRGLVIIRVPGNKLPPSKLK